MITEITIREGMYYCYQDEKYFYAWLEGIPAVKSVSGTPAGLTVAIELEEFDLDCFADLIGLLMRYGLDMRPLKACVTPQNEAWARDRTKFWFNKIFEDG